MGCQETLLLSLRMIQDLQEKLNNCFYQIDDAEGYSVFRTASTAIEELPGYQIGHC